MDLVSYLNYINAILAVPCTLLFLGVGIFLTIKTGFLQIFGLPKFFKLITGGVKQQQAQSSHAQTMSPMHALFTAMATTIGVGNVVGPSVAIMIGGPGALFWLILYIIIGSATKFTEVVFAIVTRVKMAGGYVTGGPVRYLQSVHRYLGYWYGYIMVFLFVAWSGTQANTLAQIYALENVPAWCTGLALAVIAYGVLIGGTQRVGNVASKLVPVMFLGYVTFALYILLKDVPAVLRAMNLVAHSIFNTSAPTGAFAGATVFQAMRYGVYRGIFITESGTGTSSIAHAVADVQKPTDQAILAMFSAGADAFLCLLSGLLVLVTGVWTQGVFRSTLIYEVFKQNSPVLGQTILLISISLFVITTVIGNCFNGLQSFSALTNNRFVRFYIGFTLLNIFVGALLQVKLMWEITDTLLALVVIPNLIGLVILACKYPDELKI